MEVPEVMSLEDIDPDLCSSQVWEWTSPLSGFKGLYFCSLTLKETITRSSGSRSTSIMVVQSISTRSVSRRSGDVLSKTYSHSEGCYTDAVRMLT